MKNIAFVFAMIWLAGCATEKPAPVATTPTPLATPAPRPLPATLEEAVNSPRRTPKNVERDQYRHPMQTLEFFEVKPEHSVVEIAPATGWYAEILAPYLASRGKYVGAIRNMNLMDPSNADLQKWMQSNQDVADKMYFVSFSVPEQMKLGDPGSADRVLTFRNVHNWMKSKNEAAVFKAFFNVLKPGGILGVVEHRAGKKQKGLPAETGYVPEETIIALAKKAGFKLVAKSEINANPKDTKDHPEGVWTLPPTLRLGDKDREKYLGIGESDRMTLKFMKPAKK